MSVTIGNARVKKVFATKETTSGTLVFPSAGDFIYAHSGSTINQVAEYTDSEELRNTLDTVDQFPNARPAGSWSIPMYFRPDATLGNEPQGGVFFESLQGDVAESTFTIATLVAVDATSIAFTTLAGDRLPQKGVITIESEQIYYTSVTMSTTTTGTFTIPATGGRGYNGTTAAVHDGSGTAITGCELTSVFYIQKTSSPSFSLWLQSDHLIQGMSGCTASECSIELNNEGATVFNFSGEGMNMVWAGTSAAASATSTTALVVDDAKLFSVGARIQNETTSDTNSGSGYEITAVNVSTNTLTLGDAITASEDDVIKGYLPTETTKASPLRSKDTAITIDGSEAKFRTSTLTVSAPKNYLLDEVGTEYPEEYVEDARSITADFNLYCKKETVRYIYDGYEGNEFTLNITLGDTVGDILELYLLRCRTSSPEIGDDGPVMTLSMNMTALGTSGEDSLEFIVR